MKLTCLNEYALALVYLARCEAEKYVPVQTIAAAQGIPAKFLEQILLNLRLAKYLRSSRRKSGGFRLAKSLDKIFLTEIVRLFDGALAPIESVSKYFYESTQIEREKKLISVFRQMRDHIAENMENMTVADVI